MQLKCEGRCWGGNVTVHGWQRDLFRRIFCWQKGIYIFLIEHFCREMVKFYQFFRVVLLQIHFVSESGMTFPDPDPAKSLDPQQCPPPPQRESTDTTFPILLFVSLCSRDDKEAFSTVLLLLLNLLSSHDKTEYFLNFLLQKWTLYFFWIISCSTAGQDCWWSRIPLFSRSGKNFGNKDGFLTLSYTSEGYPALAVFRPHYL